MKIKTLQYKSNCNDVKNTTLECEELIKDCVYTSHFEGDLYSIVFLFSGQGIVIDCATMERINASKERAKLFYDNYLSGIEQAAKDNKFMKNIDIELFRRLNMPVNHLIEAKNAFLENKKIEDAKKEAEKIELQKIKEQAEKNRLEKMFLNLKNGEYITSFDFLALCELKNIALHPRTKGQLNNYSTIKVSMNGLTVPNSAKNKSFAGVFSAVNELKNCN